MERQYGEFSGVDNVYTALVLKDTLQEYVTTPPEFFAPTSEIAAEAETENTTTHYNNEPSFNYVSEGVTTITLTLSGVPASLAAKYLGKYYDAATGRVLDNGMPNPPDVALSFRLNKGPNDYRYYQYLKGNFRGGTEEAATRTNSVDIRTYQMIFTAVKTAHKWLYNNKKDGVKRIYAETTDLAFTSEDDWFSRVQTPETIAPPDALVLVSTVPADDAIDVAVTAPITLTFNNAVSSATVLLLSSAGLLLPTVVTFDVSGKIATITPTAQLSAASEYRLIVAQATDVYNQSITNEVITFTTA